MKPSASGHALGWLEQEATFRSLTDRAGQLLALQGELRLCAPTLELIAMGIDQDTLVVGTPGAGSAAKLRQLEPTIIARLGARGWTVKRIRFRPTPRGMAPPAPPVRPRAPIPASVLPALTALASTVEGDALKQALEHLAKAHRRAGRG